MKLQIRGGWKQKQSENHADVICTEAPEKACTWLGEMSSCSCLTSLPDPAWVLLRKIYKPFPGPLNMAFKLINLQSFIKILADCRSLSDNIFEK